MGSVANKIKELQEKQKKILAMGGPDKIEAQHKAGKLSARERLNLLFDNGFYDELYSMVEHECTKFGLADKEFPADGVVTAIGAIDGRPVCVASQDFTVMGGSVGWKHAWKISEIAQQAFKNGMPLITINDSGGARIQEGVDSLRGYGTIFYNNTLLSGVVPQIAIISGPCAGGAAYSPALMDFIIMVKGTGKMFITGPDVIKEVTGKVIDVEELGGAMAHAVKSGNIHFVANDDNEAIEICKKLLSYIPNNNTEDPPYEPQEEIELVEDEYLNSLLPDDPQMPYDIHSLLERVFDKDSLFEIQKEFAPNIVISFARLNGRPVGIVANQPSYLAGCLDIDSSDKAARFIRFCNAFNIPIITFTDTPGFMPGIEQEYGGIIRHGAKMLFAYSAATVPKITVILRKAYGGAYLAMCAKSLGADRVAAWPTAEIAVMGAEGAVSVLYKKEIQKAENPEQKRKELIEQYRAEFATPYQAAKKGMVDAVIEPKYTRNYISIALEACTTKRELRPQKKHGLIPL
ncbi:MAG TPA: acyl-CoA carboxylase subunit beta [Ignavibacteriales bacterium]|nr:acyl-CoA carboxylase subunit beta [Ignavibacteriales bacterium]HPD67493.1 acyl-CoA carboxylase subunit beta [Ignavibacteriales bacterium]